VPTRRGPRPAYLSVAVRDCRLCALGSLPGVTVSLIACDIGWCSTRPAQGRTAHTGWDVDSAVFVAEGHQV
jgi:hypothetical protein